MATGDRQVDFADLDPATEAVRDMVAESRELTGRMARVMQMNPNDMAAIGALVQHGPMGVIELAEHLGIRSASATAMVDRLENAGHVVRVRETSDRRRVTVTATPAATQAAYLAWAPLITEMDDVARALDSHERDIIVKFLGSMLAVSRSGGRVTPAGEPPAARPSTDHPAAELQEAQQHQQTGDSHD